MRQLKIMLASWLGIMGLTLIFLLPRASADSISYYVNSPNSGISGFTGPYATATVNLTSSTTATITFDSLSNGNYTYLLGDGGAVGFNVNGAYTLGTISGTNTLPPSGGFSPGPYSNGGAGNEDGFGSFNQRINSFDGFSHSANEIVVNITATGLNSWASASDVLSQNSAGYLVAAHIFVAQNCATSCENTGITGFAAGNTVVPEPATALLVGTLLSGLGFFGRKKFIATLKN